MAIYETVKHDTPLIGSLLREHIRREIETEFQKMAKPVIDAAVERACAEFETTVMLEMEYSTQKRYVDYVVARRKQPA